MYIKFLYDSVKPQYTLAFFSIKNEEEVTLEDVGKTFWGKTYNAFAQCSG